MGLCSNYMETKQRESVGNEAKKIIMKMEDLKTIPKLLVDLLA